MVFVLDHLVVNGRISLILMAEKHSIEQMYHGFFISSSFDAHIRCFYVFAIADYAGINIGLQISFSNAGLIPLGHMAD